MTTQKTPGGLDRLLFMLTVFENGHIDRVPGISGEHDGVDYFTVCAPEVARLSEIANRVSASFDRGGLHDPWLVAFGAEATEVSDDGKKLKFERNGTVGEIQIDPDPAGLKWSVTVTADKARHNAPGRTGVDDIHDLVQAMVNAMQRVTVAAP